MIKSYLGMKELDKKAKHLGISLLMKKNKLSAFEDLRQKVEARFQGWKAKLLSQVGRVTLLKHVATSIPVYTISTFLLPKQWCDNFEKLSCGRTILRHLEVSPLLHGQRCVKRNLEEVLGSNELGGLTEH